MTTVRDVAKMVIPRSFIRTAFALINTVRRQKFRGKSNSYIFSEIYTKNMWGGSKDKGFYSGRGSHEEHIVKPYVACCVEFLSSFDTALVVVDLGCGDFNIGSRIAPAAKEYIACDVVPSLIEDNKKKFNFKNCRFQVVDMSKDEIPAGDVVIIRQVLQHLSNQDITNVVRKIEKSFDYLILTEHLPDREFTPNLDKPTGVDIRAPKSGIVLDKPPFNINFVKKKNLLKVDSVDGSIITDMYQLK